jgi:hypothetical protein
MDKIRALTGSQGGPRPWATFVAPGGEPVPPEATPSARPRAVSSVRFMQGAARIRWTWDETTRAYLRAQGSAPFTDADGRPLRFSNIVFLWVEVNESDCRDAAGNPTPVLTLTGEGDALVLHSGVEQQGRWVRPSLTDPPTLVDRKGRPLMLVPGPSWIHLMPVEVSVFVRR